MKNQMGLIAELWCGKKQKQNTEVKTKTTKYPVWRTVRNKDCKDVERFSDPWDNKKWSEICVIRSLRMKVREWGKNMNLQICKVPYTLNRINIKERTL